MNRGYIKLWRKSLDAGWIKNHSLWAFWTYCLMKASYKEFDAIVGLQVVHLMPGQFIFGRRIAAKETGLSIRRIRTHLAFLIMAGNLTIKTTNKFSIITIVNWHSYQGEVVENDQQNDQQRANKGPHTRIKELKNKNPEAISEEISLLLNKYSNQEIINQALTAIKQTRKTNQIKDTVKLSILQAWNQYPVESVVAGIRKYLEKNRHLQGKKESYLLAIIRDQKPSPDQGAVTGPRYYKEITADNIGELHAN